jgi:hypothetical protein
MTQLSNFSLDQLAGAVALGLSSIGGLMLILFKSKCTTVNYSCCWGLFKYDCARAVIEDSSDEEGGAGARGEDVVQP